MTSFLKYLTLQEIWYYDILWLFLVLHSSFLTLKVTTPLKSLGVTWYTVVPTDLTSPNLWANYATTFLWGEDDAPLGTAPSYVGGPLFFVPNMCVGSLLGIPNRPLSVRLSVYPKTMLPQREYVTHQFTYSSPWGADPVPGARFFLGGSRKLIFVVVKIN